MYSKQLLFSVVMGVTLLVAASLSAAAPSAPGHPGPGEIHGPGSIQLGEDADLKLPEGFGFLDQEGTRHMLQRLGSIATGSEIGLIAPSSHDWFVVLKNLPVGYTDDYGWENLDAGTTLAGLRAIEEKANAERVSAGAGSVDLAGWAVPPVYDPVHHRLEWAVNAVTPSGPVANHIITILGRHGSVQFFLVDQNNSERNVSTFRQLVNGFTFREGRRYEDHGFSDARAPGDLAFLITGTTSLAAHPHSATNNSPRVLALALDFLKSRSWALPGLIGISAAFVFLALKHHETWTLYQTWRRRQRAARHARKAGHKPRFDPVKYYATVTRDLYRNSH